MEDGLMDDLLKVPLDSVWKKERPSSGLEADGVLGWELGKDPCTSDGGQIRDALGQRPLEVNSMVQIQYKEGELAFGIIRWMGYLPQMEDKMAGVELAGRAAPRSWRKSLLCRAAKPWMYYRGG
ncbi:hypothetical protein FKM82_021278 [Ascaphus truei]